MEPEGSLPHSQPPVTCPYLKPDQSSPSLPISRLEDPFNIIFLHMPRLSKWSLLLRSPHRNSVCTPPTPPTSFFLI